jgi:cell division protease FtsH
MRFVRNGLFPLIVVVLLAYLAAQTLRNDDEASSRIAYGALIARVETAPDSIASVLFIPKSQGIDVTLAQGTTLESNYPTEAAQLDLQRRLQNEGIPFDSKGTGDSAWRSILTYLLPFVLFFGFWIFLMRQAHSRKSRADEGGPPVDLRES